MVGSFFESRLELTDTELKLVSSFVSFSELVESKFELTDAELEAVLSFSCLSEIVASLLDLTNLEFKLNEGCTSALLAVKAEGAEDTDERNSATFVGPEP